MLTARNCNFRKEDSSNIACTACIKKNACFVVLYSRHSVSSVMLRRESDLNINKHTKNQFGDAP